MSGLLEYIKTGKARCPWRNSVVDGVPWGEEIWCGSGDRIFLARKVDDLRVAIDPVGKERFLWTERKRPDLSRVRDALGLPAPGR